ncbi:tRNA (adenosine(37)-N6)-dimethylallyltransferase MiaA [Candidatus Kaiserbacteria bacterium]|nr:MAG: tRNA (adenosine(37)-N6)-dimethylallyltransferase MiaA [Candidatus Kaiserbacteria bacterium]
MDTGSEKIIVIVGTNASGKSSLAVRLAKKYGGEIISADSRQVYKGLDIATGKVTKEEMGGIPHHLIDVADPREVYSAADFATQGRNALSDILSRKKLPIIAGGTGFYIDALLNPSLLASTPPNDELRKGFELLPADVLFAQLKNIDPRRAAVLEEKGEQNLVRRIIRSLEIALAPKRKDIEAKNKVLELDVLWIGVRWDKEKLKERIHERTLIRLENGMIEEAQELHKNGLSWKRMEELGLEYKHLADYLREKITKDQLIEYIDRDDARYAKRQRTWFKRNEKINWFEGGKLDGVEDLVEKFLQ